MKIAKLQSIDDTVSEYLVLIPDLVSIFLPKSRQQGPEVEIVKVN